MKERSEDRNKSLRHTTRQTLREWSKNSQYHLVATNMAGPSNKTQAAFTHLRNAIKFIAYRNGIVKDFSYMIRVTTSFHSEFFAIGSYNFGNSKQVGMFTIPICDIHNTELLQQATLSQFNSHHKIEVEILPGQRGPRSE